MVTFVAGVTVAVFPAFCPEAVANGVPVAVHVVLNVVPTTPVDTQTPFVAVWALMTIFHPVFELVGKPTVVPKSAVLGEEGMRKLAPETAEPFAKNLRVQVAATTVPVIE